MRSTKRIGTNGEVVRSLDVEGSRETVRWLLAQNIESLAVCLINAYVNPTHERRLSEIIDELAPNLPVSLSCEVLPEIREYERTSTTVINAVLQPIVSRYLRTMVNMFDNPHLPLYVMQSNGGVMSASAAADRPIHIIESGPAAGVIAALTLAERVGIANVLTLDMGGTTAKLP